MLFTEAISFAEGKVVDYTPSVARIAGEVVQLGGRAAICVTDIAADKLGAAHVVGLFKIRNAAVIGNLGDNLWWDEDADPVSGDTGSGAATTNASVGDFWIGTLCAALAAADEEVVFALNVKNPDQPAWPRKTHELKSDNYSVDAADAGKVLHIATDAKAFTLPATVAGLRIIIVNDGADAGVLVTISPNSNDKIMGPDIAGTDDKDQLNTKTTAIRGDYMVLVGDGADGWFIEAMRGTWAEQG